MAGNCGCDAEDLLLSGDSTVEYGGSSSDCENDCSTDEYSSSIASGSTGDSNDFDGSSVEGSDDEEVIEIDRDDGNFANDTWRLIEADYSSDELLDPYSFSPLGVAGQPKNCIPPESKPEEYVCMFLGELLQVIVVDTNHYARAKFAARESAFPDKNHSAWVDITLEEMMAFLGLVVNMNLIHKGDVREYWSTNPSRGTPFFREIFHRDRFLQILYNFHYPELEGSVHRLRKELYLVQHLSQ